MTGTAQAAATAAPTEPVAGSPEYDAAMAAKGSSINIQAFSTDGKTSVAVSEPTPSTTTAEPAQPVVPPAERPAWLPEAFKTEAEFKEWYSSTEKGKVETPSVDPAKPDENTPQVDLNKPAEPTQVTQKFFDEFASKGSLTEASYAELAKMGFDKGVVDAYIAGQSALVEQRTQAGYAAVGGKESFDKMAAWASANLAPNELATFNAQVGQSLDVATLAVKGLQARFIAATGSNPTGLLSGSANPVAPNSGFASRAQVTEAMRNPKYESDPAYRASVMDRLRVTPDSVI